VRSNPYQSQEMRREGRGVEGTEGCDDDCWLGGWGGGEEVKCVRRHGEIGEFLVGGRKIELLSV